MFFRRCYNLRMVHILALSVQNLLRTLDVKFACYNDTDQLHKSCFEKGKRIMNTKKWRTSLLIPGIVLFGTVALVNNVSAQEVKIPSSAQNNLMGDRLLQRRLMSKYQQQYDYLVVSFQKMNLNLSLEKRMARNSLSLIQLKIQKRVKLDLKSIIR